MISKNEILLFAIAFPLTMFVLWMVNGEIVSKKERIELLESRVEALEREVWPETMTTETKGACNR